MSLPVIHHPEYSFALPQQHPFPMQKFTALRENLARFGQKIQWHKPDEIGFRHLARAHSPSYLNALLAGALDDKAQRRSGFPWSAELVRRVRLETGGTLLAARIALAEGLALNAAGGTHHAHVDYASGYCLINDLAVAAAALLSEGQVKQILIIDLDVHQGDGTARIFADDPRVFTLSVHAARNFPANKAQSDCDVALADGVDDATYLKTIADVVPPILSRLSPDLVIYDAGVDVHTDDRLGHFALTDAGILGRDRWVIQAVRQARIPLVGVIGGGYDRDTSQLAARHALLFEAALTLDTAN
ncbi:MAG: histone deacetylase [Gammaproteobacteria bacterium]|nr:histone deacetylase [Gammaproteobacteria bacterium]